MAKDDLGLVDFKSPEEYLALDDCTVWAMLKRCHSSQEIIKRLERRRLIKCAYDPLPFYIKDKIVSSIFNVEGIRNNIRDKIAEEAGVKPDLVIIDVPTLPSVPYHYSVLSEPMEITMFQRTRDGRKTYRKLSEISGIFDVLKGFMNILRVYTEEEYLKEVQLAAEKLFGDLPSSMKISY